MAQTEFGRIERADDLLVVKVGTGVVSNPERDALDKESMQSIGRQVAVMLDSDDFQGDIVLVSSGAISAGIEELGGMSRAEVDLDLRRMQAAAMVGNLGLMNAWREALGRPIGFDLPTHNDLDSNEAWGNIAVATRGVLEHGAVPIFNEGDARSTEELKELIESSGKPFERFGDNDQLAAMLAAQLGKYMLRDSGRRVSLLYLTDKDGVLDDPSDESSVLPVVHDADIDSIIERSAEFNGAGRGGIASKLYAARLAIRSGVEVRIGPGRGEKSLFKLLSGEIGTRVGISQKG